MRALGTAVALVLCLGVSGTASGHKGHLHRRVFLEATKDSLVVLAHLSLSGRSRRAALLTLADTNKDGRITDDERRRVRDDLAAQAVSGLTLYLDGAPVKLTQTRAKLELPDGDRPIEVLVHGAISLTDAATKMTLQNAEPGAHITLRLLPGARRLSCKEARRVAKSMREMELDAGERVDVAVSAASPGSRTPASKPQ